MTLKQNAGERPGPGQDPVTSSAPRPADEQLAALLNSARPAPRWRRWLIPALLLALVVMGLAWWLAGPSGSGTRYTLEPVTQGTLRVTVSATGSLQPTNQVDVGSELSGTVAAVLVDDNDRVTRGQVLARLDTARLQDQTDRARATLAAAEARVLQAQATVREASANLKRLREISRLSGGTLPSRAELETAEATLARAEADEASARAAVAEARAALRSDETNLAKASIRSPIDGVVLLRQVEPGQTVAASLQAPVLFTLAEDLAQMKLEVDVDEADVGQVRAGQEAVFTVDAYSGRHYPARITRVGYGSQVKEGVVSYLTVLEVNNDDLSLRPGMTANAVITTAVREDALLVANAALRFQPPAAANAGAPSDGGFVSKLMPRPPRTTLRRPAQASPDGSRQVWVLEAGEPKPIAVKVGASDGRRTEVLEGELQPGMQVITEALVSAR